jgi:hypothetical protein
MNTKKIYKYLASVLLGFITVSTLTGQDGSTTYDLFNLLENNKLEPFNRQIALFSESDKKGIQFSKNPGDGIAWLKGIEFFNGIIEIDIRGKDIFQQSFVGIAFHGADNRTFDAIYFRPFNFQSKDAARKIHAVQYVSHPEYPWQVLREKFPGQYEKEVNPAPNGNDWFHAKIVIQYPRITVFINGNAQPSLTVEKLNDRKTGKIGLWVGNNSDGDFANLKITDQK